MRSPTDHAPFVRSVVDALSHLPALGRPMARSRRTTFLTGMEKARWLDARARLDSLRPGPRTMLLLEALRRLPLAARCGALHAFCRDAIRYVRDPGGHEELADCETILGRLLDDCDGKATVFCTVAPAIGLEARVRGVFQRGAFRHAQAEARWPGSMRHPAASPSGWVLCEFICEGVELGQGSEAARRDDAGKIITTDPR